MHVKESVKEFVHDVKRKFSQKHKRESCSTCTSESYDGASSDSSSDTLSHIGTRDSVASSLLSSPPTTPERSRLVTFVHPRMPFTHSAKHYRNVLHKVRRIDEKRHRLPSKHAVDSLQVADRASPLSFQDAADEGGPIGALEKDYTDVLDICAQSVEMGSIEESSQLMSHDGSQTEFDKESHSDTSGTLVTTGSGPDYLKSASESDSRFDLLSDATSLVSSMARPADLGEEITLAHSVSLPAILHKPTAAPLPPLPPPPPTKSTPASPDPVYIPRLTAPSMFLPIPNTDPLSALLTKHLPAEHRPRRDVVGEYAGRDVHEMVISNSWRALANMARDRIVASDPEDLGRILDLWFLRLSSLARLRLTNQASAECTNLFAVLNAVPPASVPGSFPGPGPSPPSAPFSSSPPPMASLPLSPSGLGTLAQLPGTPSQKSSTLPPLPTSGAAPATASRQGTNELAYPFELTVFHARVHYWSGDPLGYVDALSRILGRCKDRAREEGRVVVQQRELRKVAWAQRGGDVESTSQPEQTNEGDEDEDEDKDEGQDEDNSEGKGEQEDGNGEDEGEGKEDTEGEGKEDAEAAEQSKEGAEVQDNKDTHDVLATAEANLSMWLERIARVCLILVSQMIEMNDYQAAINLLVPLCTQRVPPTSVPTPSPALHSALARVYLLSGNLQKAEEHFSIAASAAGNSANGTDNDIIVTNTALLAAASGDWARAEEALGVLVVKDPGNFTAINNLAVTLLSQGRIKEGIDLLEAALKTSPSSVVVAEPFLFNLSTLYELRSTAAIDKKRELLLEVAKWSGDGLKTSCLKMPSS